VDRMSSKQMLGAGFTFTEIVCILAILAFITSMALPSMRKVIDENRTRSQANRLMTAINLARSEAVRRNSPVSLCPSSMASTGITECSGSYEVGWIIFTNKYANRYFDAVTDSVIKAFVELPPGFTVRNRSGLREAEELITYFPDGSSRRNMTLSICPPADSPSRSWSVVLNIVGRARISSNWSACP
jgi:type IV fimbrial biogenesis protein FimT